MTLKISSTTIKFEGERVSHSVGSKVRTTGAMQDGAIIIPLFPFGPDWRDLNNSKSNPRGVLVFMSDLSAFNLLHNFAV